MWVHIEEPEPTESILDPSGERIWFITSLKDTSGSVSVGIPQRCALELAKVSDKETFVERHKEGDLNIPLLCHVRISRTVRGVDGASQPVGSSQSSEVIDDSKRIYVNLTLEAVEPVSWEPLSAPNAAYTDVLTILNKCPSHDEGLVFACLADIQPDPYCGMNIVYDGSNGSKGVYAAALIACPNKSKTDPIGDNAYKVVTRNVKDIGYAAGSPDKHVGNHTLVGYCSLNNLPGFRLDPPRGREVRVALVFINKVDDEGFHIHKLEYIEPDQVNDAIICMKRLRTLNRQIRPVSTEKRSHNLTLHASDTKKARTLSRAPTDVSLPDTWPMDSEPGTRLPTSPVAHFGLPRTLV